MNFGRLVSLTKLQEKSRKGCNCTSARDARSQGHTMR